MIYCGIDPGASGAIALMDEQARVVCTYMMPMLDKELNVHAVMTILRDAMPSFTLVEKQRPTKGKVASYRVGRHEGALEALLVALSLPHRLVQPQEWKKAILTGMPKGKEASVLFCQRRWPDVSLLPTERSRKPSDGIGDALCLALLARNEAHP